MLILIVFPPEQKHICEMGYSHLHEILVNSEFNSGSLSDECPQRRYDQKVPCELFVG